MPRPKAIATNCKHFLWNAPAMPLFIGISFITIVLSVQLLIVVKGDTRISYNPQTVKQTLTDAR